MQYLWVRLLGVSKHWTGFSTGMWDWNVGLDYQAGLWDWNSGVLAPKPMLAGTDNRVFLITNLVLNLSLLDE